MDKKLLSLLCCPVCKGTLLKKKNSLYCTHCQYNYTVKRGIPVLLKKEDMTEHMEGQIEYFSDEDKSRPKYALQAWQESYLRRFFDNIKFRKNNVVVDIACGSGYMAIELAKKGAYVIASDITINQLYKLQVAAKKLKIEDRLLLVCCSAEYLPFKNESADIITENAIIEHLYQEKLAIQEIDRIAKRHAQLMVSTPLSYRYVNPLLIPVNYFHDKRIGHLRRYDISDFRKKFKNWKIVRTYYTGHFAKFILFTLAVVLKTERFDVLAERIDRGSEQKKYGASVITSFFVKRK